MLQAALHQSWPPDGCSVDMDGVETFNIFRTYTVAFSNKKLKTRKHMYNLIYMTKVHSSTEQNLSYNFEALHRARAVKSPTVVIFEETK